MTTLLWNNVIVMLGGKLSVSWHYTGVYVHANLYYIKTAVGFVTYKREKALGLFHTLFTVENIFDRHHCELRTTMAAQLFMFPTIRQENCGLQWRVNKRGTTWMDICFCIHGSSNNMHSKQTVVCQNASFFFFCYKQDHLVLEFRPVNTDLQHLKEWTFHSSNCISAQCLMISRLKPRLSVPDFARQNPERKALVRDYIISMPPLHSLVKTPTINCFTKLCSCII